MPTREDLERARARVEGVVRRTPVETCRTLDRMAGASLFFKCEHLQRGGAFKLRGATNAVASLTQDEAARGVATHSSGNHAAALAIAAARRGIEATIVMPVDAPAIKRAAVEGYGARIVSCGPTLADREGTLADVVAKSGAAVVHPYDDARIVAGQATAAIELFEQVPELDVVIAPIGGGGLLSGTVLAAKFFSPGTRVIGAEPALADDAAESLRLGERQPQRPPRTVADGLRTAIGAIPFEVLRTHDVEVRTVSEEDIVRAMRTTWERAKLPIEASSAVAVAVAIDGGFANARVGVVLSGGNVDLTRLPWQ
ncbi:MAG: pyridoxal-phosphate dependent enzyme [Sandaracinus sp.]|nr:pyridoxal-phosphate dependent enzyme [Sandaracinus sp.]MCB9633195.1 pyridoxal-phosphate dependent enzyme [Sandaracinus sp.]